jgi:hypothetical protein
MKPLLFRLGLLAALIAANWQLAAQDASCNKACGAGYLYDWGDRSCAHCSYCCSWSLCSNQTYNCEYPGEDRFNDYCGMSAFYYCYL